MEQRVKEIYLNMLGRRYLRKSFGNSHMVSRAKWQLEELLWIAEEECTLK